MKATQVSKENGVVKFNIEFSAEEFKEALSKAYLANRGKFQIDGFRKGKAPRKIIESHYGHDVFWDEALNDLLEKNYSEAIKDMDIEVISQPSFESLQQVIASLFVLALFELGLLALLAAAYLPY